MKRSVLLALSALMAGAMSLPAGAAGTNEKTPDAAATGATGTGSNAMDRSTDRTMDRSTNANADTRSSAATGASAADNDNTADTHAKKSKRKARHVKKSPDAAQNHGAVGGESAGKSSDSPSQ